MSFPTELSNAIDGVTEVVAAHLNNLEAKVGTDNSAVPTSLDYLLKNGSSIDPGHKHTAGAFSGGNNGDVFHKAAGAWGPGTPDTAGLVAKSGDQSIDGVKTFTSIPLGPGSNPTANNQLARKAYVDLMLPLAGGTMAGNIALNNHKVTGLAAASGAGEALRYDEWIAAQDPGHKHSKLWASDGSPEAVTVDAAGNVGIGLTSPGVKLDISSSDPSIYLRNSDAANVANINQLDFRLNSDSAERSYFKISVTSEVITDASRNSLVKFETNNAGSYTTAMAIKGGNVGIGKTSPGYLLDMESSGGGYYSASDHAWHNGSSIRWKKNIKPIENPLAVLQQLTGVTFKWKNTGLSGMSLIAEEVGKVIPEAVSYSKEEPDFCDGFNPGALVGILVEAVKAQQTQIDALQAKLN